MFKRLYRQAENPGFRYLEWFDQFDVFSQLQEVATLDDNPITEMQAKKVWQKRAVDGSVKHKQVAAQEDFDKC